MQWRGRNHKGDYKMIPWDLFEFICWGAIGNECEEEDEDDEWLFEEDETD